MTKNNFKRTNIGICQGRLTSSPENQLQWFPGNKWKDEFKIAKELGYNYIEILAERTHNKDNPIWNKEEREKITRISNKYTIEMYSACLDYIIENSIFDGKKLSEKVIEYTKKFIDYCKAINIKIIVFPMMEESIITKNNIELVKKFINVISRKCRSLDIVMSIESNESTTIINEVLKGYKKSEVGCVYDTGNRVLRTKCMSEEINTLSNHINHIHLKDKDKDNNNVVIGTGLVNFIDVFKTLKLINYNKRLTFETNRGNHVKETAAHNIAYINFIMKEVYYND